MPHWWNGEYASVRKLAKRPHLGCGDLFVGSTLTWGTMKKIIIRYKGLILKVHLSRDNTTILDSYKVSSPKDMKSIIYHIREQVTDDVAINIRSVSSMIYEWRVHNLLYTLGIMRARTSSVDLNINQPWYIKILYAILSPLYFHFY